MNSIDLYIQTVLRNVQARPAERQRIEADLRAHIQEALSAGDPPQVVLGRMGSPVEIAQEFMSQVRLQFAGFGARLGAFLIDIVVLIVMAGTLGAIAVGLSNLVPRQPAGSEYVLGGALIAVIAGCVLGVIGGFLLYFPLTEGRFGQTLGKRILGLRVLREDGLPIGYKEAFLRRLSFYFEILPLDALFIPFTEKRQRGFDIIARTVVIHER